MYKRLQRKLSSAGILKRILGWAGFLALVMGASDWAKAQEYNGKELVKASLISDVKVIQPGQKF